MVSINSTSPKRSDLENGDPDCVGFKFPLIPLLRREATFIPITDAYCKDGVSINSTSPKRSDVI